MKKVRLVGFFVELPYGNKDGESLKAAVGGLNKNEIDRVITYLKSGVLWIASPGITRDVLAKDSPIIGAGGIVTDGEWAWHRDLPYYVDKYAIGLPSEFRRHMANNEWTVGAVDVSNLEL